MIKVLYKPLFLLLGALGAFGAVVAGKISGRAGKRVDGDDESAGRTPSSAVSRPHNGSTGLTRDQLYDEARRRGIKGRSKMSKAELEKALGRVAGSPDLGSGLEG